MVPGDNVDMSEISWPEYERRVAAGCVVILPVGSTEQHGPHLPLGTDWMLARGIAQLVAREIGGLVAPSVIYGYKSHARTGGGSTFPGTLNLSGSVFTDLVKEVLLELLRQNAKKILVLNTHYENEWFIREAAELTSEEAIRHDAKILFLAPWDVSDPDVIASLYSGDQPLRPDLQHAAWIETSMAMYLFPELVDETAFPPAESAAFPPYDIFPATAAGVPASGSLTSVGPASRAAGEGIVTHRVARIVEVARREFGQQ